MTDGKRETWREWDGVGGYMRIGFFGGDLKCGLGWGLVDFFDGFEWGDGLAWGM